MINLIVRFKPRSTSDILLRGKVMDKINYPIMTDKYQVPSTRYVVVDETGCVHVIPPEYIHNVVDFKLEK